MNKYSFFSEIYGCQMNVSDSLELESALENEGFLRSSTLEDADIILINTCAVRQSAEDRVLKRLGYYKFLKKSKPRAVVFMGCVAEKEKEKVVESYPFVDYVVGTKYRHRIPSLLKSHYEYYDVSTSESVHQRVFSSYLKDKVNFLHAVPDKKFPYRAYITIISGCNKFCTYCIVPYTRGLEQSVPSQEIIKQVQQLTSDGVKEIYLLGQNVNSYGVDSGDISFPKLLNLVSKVPGVERINFISSHPRDVTDELIDEMASNKKLSQNLHFAMQSGSDSVLKRMNRQHTYEHFYSIIQKIRLKIPNLYLSTDIIAGFPGETQSDFELTLKALHEIKFHSAFIYMYSERSGTAAAIFQDSIPPEQKKSRVQTLMNVQDEYNRQSLNSLVGKVAHVLVENSGREAYQMLGFNEYGVRTIFESEKPLEEFYGSMIKVKIEAIKGKTAYGSLI